MALINNPARDTISGIRKDLGKQPSMYSSGAARKQLQVPYLEPAQTSDMLSGLAQGSLSTLETIGAALDTPGAAVRGALVGKPLSFLGENISGQKRVTGSELTDYYGLTGDDTNPYIKSAAGFTAELALDPLAMISGPASAFTRGGKAVRAANLLDDAGDAAYAALGVSRAARNEALSGRRLYKQLIDKGVPTTPQNIKNFGVIGPREARTGTSVRQVAELPQTLLGRNATSEAKQRAASEVAERVSRLEDYLRPLGSTFEDVAEQKITGNLGLGYFSPEMTFELPGLAPAAQTLDALGQFAKWNPATRRTSALFQKKVGGETSIPEQLASMRKYESNVAQLGIDSGKAALFGETVRRAKMTDEAKSLLGSDDLLGPEGRNFMIRMLEDVGNATDKRISDGIEGFDDILTSYRNVTQGQQAKSASLGMRGANMSSPRYGNKFFPRYADEIDFGNRSRAGGGALYGTRDQSQLGRKAMYETPGGTVDLIEASELTEMQKLIKGEDGSSLQAAADEIKQYLDTKHARGSDTARTREFDRFKMDSDTGDYAKEYVLDSKGNRVRARSKQTGKLFDKTRRIVDPEGVEVISRKQAEQIANFIKREHPKFTNVSDEALKRPAGLRGSGIYQAHPLQALGRNARAQGQIQDNAKLIYGELAQDAAQQSMRPNMDVENIRGLGKGYKRLDRALNEISQETSLVRQRGVPAEQVRNNLKESLRRELDLPTGQDIDLKKFAVSDDVVERLRKTKNFYTSDKAQDEILGYLDQYTGLFKSLLLAFPSRHTRDMYSNAISVYFEVGNPMTAHWGFSAAKMIYAGEYEAAEEMLRLIPKYKNIYNQTIKGQGSEAASLALREAFVKDTAESGVLRGLASSDLTTTLPGEGKLNQLLPGINKTTYGTTFGELGKGYSAEDFFSVRGIGLNPEMAPMRTKNPFLNFSEKLSDYSDGIARLGGMLAMMKQGNAPEYAAKRLSSALVDYSSLTNFERGVIKRFIFPWWSYNSRIGKYAVESMIQRPGGGYAQMIRAMSTLQRPDDDTYIPDALRQSFAMRVPYEDVPLLKNAADFLGFGQGDTTTFLRDFDVPGVDMLSLIAMKPTAFGSIQDTASNIALQAHAPVQQMMALASGQDIFSKRPLAEARTSLDKIYSGLTGNENARLNPLLKIGASLVPSPRLAGVAGNLLDPRLPQGQRAVKTLVNALSGVKLQDVSPQYQLSEARRKAAEQLEGFMTDYTESYIPKDRLSQVPEELMPYYQLYRTLGKELRDRRKAAKEQ
jgi:hypothetical protein